MVVAMISSNTLQFQYFWDFCLQALFSQLSFENFWLYLLVATLFWLKIIKNIISHLLSFVNLRSELSSHQTYSKMLRQFSKGSLISISSESTKFIFSSKFCIGLSCLTFADISCSTLWMSPCVLSSSATLCRST